MRCIVYWFIVYNVYLVSVGNQLDGYNITQKLYLWWRHQMETFSALLALCLGVNSPHKSQWGGPFDVFFDLRLNKRLSKQSWGWWFETPSRSSWRHCNAKNYTYCSPFLCFIVAWYRPILTLNMLNCLKDYKRYLINILDLAFPK